MVDVNEYPSSLRGESKLNIIRALQGLPISTKNAVEDSKVIKVRKYTSKVIMFIVFV